jgi:hypothetical protein
MRQFAFITLAFLLSAPLADATSNEGAAPWPTSTTPPPSVAAWKAAPASSFERVVGQRAPSCQIKRIEEWINVRCPDFKAAAVTQLGGNRGDVSYFIEPAGADRVPGPGQVTFPVRSGDRRVFLFWTLGPGYDGPLTVVPAVVLQESWLAGSDSPSITLNDALHEPVATKTHPRTQAKER